jgi:type IV secretory pathway protease TraF
VPVSPEIVRVQNSWVVSDGVTALEVCTGAAGHDPSKGRFFILREDERTGQQKLDIVDVPGSGALIIIEPPTGANVETSAQRGILSFIGRSGVRGSLDLGEDSVTLK